jgi:hypothetical protein
MLLAFGKLMATRHLAEGGLIVILAAIAIVVLVIYWPRITNWIERRWSSR